MKKMIRLIVFLMVVILSAAYPVSRIIVFERPEQPPKTFLFRSGGYDPVDLFRGHYIRLNALPRSIPLADGVKNAKYAVLGTDSEGVATVLKTVMEPPKGSAFVELDYNWGNDKEWFIRLPFNKFYINETDSEKADNLVRNAKQCLIKVDVYHDGRWTIRDLLIDGRPLRECLKEEEKEK